MGKIISGDGIKPSDLWIIVKEFAVVKKVQGVRQWWWSAKE